MIQYYNKIFAPFPTWPLGVAKGLLRPPLHFSPGQLLDRLQCHMPKEIAPPPLLLMLLKHTIPHVTYYNLQN